MSHASNSKIVRLMAEARHGDVRSASELTELYRNYLHLIARVQIDRHLQRRLSPSDVVQEALLKAWKNFGQFRGQTEEELIGWMRSIVIHAIKSAVEHEIKTAKRDLRREVPLHEKLANVDSSACFIDAALVSQASSPSAQAGQRETAAIMADRIAQLPPNFRDVIVLRNLEGVGFEEIAEQLGKSCGAVRAMWVRALARLQEISECLEQP